MDKCAVLHLGYSNPKIECVYNGSEIPSVSSMRDLGVIVSDTLKFTQHCNAMSGKAFGVLARIFRAIRCRNAITLRQAYVSYVRPLLEYASPVWSPFGYGALGDSRTIEHVQMYFARIVCYRCNVPHREYKDRLKFLNLETLEYRRLFQDLVFCFQVLKGFVTIPSANLQFLPDTRTRGHNLKLLLPLVRHNSCLYMFFNRVVPYWNNLPTSCVDSCSVPSFKANLSKHLPTIYVKNVNNMFLFA